jgi:DnaJ-class molecular chaperone
MPDGHDLVFQGASEQHPDMLPGNVIVILRSQPHSRFRRDGNHLHYEQHISLRDALLGFTKHIIHLDGRRIEIKMTTITPPGYVKVLANEGFPVHNVPSERGNLHVRFTILFPDKLSQQQKDQIATLLQ